MGSNASNPLHDEVRLKLPWFVNGTLTAAEREGSLKRWIQISSLGVYAARHHYGTDETVSPSLTGLDGYTQTKAEAEAERRGESGEGEATPGVRNGLCSR